MTAAGTKHRIVADRERIPRVEQRPEQRDDDEEGDEQRARHARRIPHQTADERTPRGAPARHAIAGVAMRTRGSAAAYRRSVTRFARTTATAASRKMPASTG